MQDSILEQFSHTELRLLDAYRKYRTCYDKKAAVNPLMQHQYCLLLNPSLLGKGDFAAKSTTMWLSLYRVEEIKKIQLFNLKKCHSVHTMC